MLQLSRFSDLIFRTTPPMALSLSQFSQVEVADVETQGKGCGVHTLQTE